MKNVKMAALAATVVFGLLSSGCATVTGGTTQDVSVKTQKDSVDVAGADCVLSNSKGTYTVVTPGKVNVHRAKDDLSVKCTKDGEVPAVTSVQSSGRTGALWGNIIMFGVGTVVTHQIDKATGGAYAYPDDITLSFGIPPAAQPAPDAGKATDGQTAPKPSAATVSGAATNDSSATLVK